MDRAVFQVLRLFRAQPFRSLVASHLSSGSGCTCRVTPILFRFISSESTSVGEKIVDKPADTVPWYRMEDDDVINARYAEKLLDASVERADKKEFQMRDVVIHAEVLIEEGEDGAVEELATPGFAMSYNLAAYVDRSPTLQKLVDLGVDLSEVESRPGQADVLVKLDFEDDVAPRIRFAPAVSLPRRENVTHAAFFSDRFLVDQGVKPEALGGMFTKNPHLLTEHLDDLEVRVEYLASKKFKREEIAGIISRSPYWLSFATVRIDGRLGYIQRLFQLTGNETREVAVRHPKIVTGNLWPLKENLFSFKKEMGFTDVEIRKILIKCPRLFKMHPNLMRTRFDYVHNELKFSHEVIAQFPAHLLNTRTNRLKERHKFLQSLGRAQYDGKLPNYVSPVGLAHGTDSEFATKIARVPVQVYNHFLKTL